MIILRFYSVEILARINNVEECPAVLADLCPHTMNKKKLDTHTVKEITI